MDVKTGRKFIAKLVIIVFTIVYLAQSFVYLDLNLSNWVEGARILLVTIGFILSLFIGTLIYIAESE